MRDALQRLVEILDVRLPPDVLEKVVVLRKDDTETNWSPKNVAYTFECPQEVKGRPGFFHIPGFSRYAISRTTLEMVNIETGHLKTWGVTKPVAEKGITGGYYITIVKSDHGRRTGLGRHRAYCLAFKKPPCHPGLLLVNHKDGVPGRDTDDNLEWTTPSQNVKHAYRSGLHGRKLVEVDAWNWRTGEILNFESVQVCSEALGLRHALIHSRLQYENSRRYPDGWRFKRANDEWAELADSVTLKKPDVEILVLDTRTGVTKIYSTALEAAKATGIKVGTVWYHYQKEPKKPISGFHFRKVDGFEGWPVT